MKLFLIPLLFTTCLQAWSNPAKLKSNELDSKVKPSKVEAQPGNEHFPIIGDRAATVGSWKINFDKMPGGQPGDSFATNSISVGLGERLELGILPWVYLVDSDGFLKYGITGKYNLYKTKLFQASLGATQLKGQFKDNQFSNSDGDLIDIRTRVDQWFNYMFFTLNFTPPDRPYNLGATVKYTEIIQRTLTTGGATLNSDLGSFYFPLNSNNSLTAYETTISVDGNYQLKGHHWMGLALGTGRLNSKLNATDYDDPEISKSEKIRYLAGASYIYRNKVLGMQDPRISVLYYEADGAQFGFSATF